jgi:hypothetical protein
MKITQTRIETRKVTHKDVIALVCDLCQTRSEGWHWSQNMYDIEESKIFYKNGYVYTTGGQVTEVSFDLCPRCFTQRLLPWLEVQGAKPTVTESSW